MLQLSELIKSSTVTVFLGQNSHFASQRTVFLLFGWSGRMLTKTGHLSLKRQKLWKFPSFEWLRRHVTLNASMQRKRAVDLIMHHLHLKYIIEGSLNGQYEQENWFQQENMCQCSFLHLTVVLAQTWETVNLSFKALIHSTWQSSL